MADLSLTAATPMADGYPAHGLGYKRLVAVTTAPRIASRVG
jgi:hypothetical protein